MNEPFGPWASALGEGTPPHLSTFWRRRMAQLASAREARIGVTRRECLRLSTAGIAACALPTLRLASAEGSNATGPAPAGRIYFPASFRHGPGDDDWTLGVFAVDPEAATWTKVCDYYWDLRVSRDGRTLALNEGNGHASVGLWALDAEGKGAKRRIADSGGDRMAWSPDCKQIIVTKQHSGQNRRVLRRETWRLDADGSGAVKLPIPETDQVDDWSPDGRWLATTSDRDSPGRGFQVYLMRPDGTGQRRLTDGPGVNGFGRFSPDGREIAYLHADTEIKTASLWIVNADGSGRRRVFTERLPDGTDLDRYTWSPDFCWSPDGESLAYPVGNWNRSEENPVTTVYGDARIAIMDTEGKKIRVLKLPQARGIGAPDWR